MEKNYYMGIDVGSTTIKIYITDQDDKCIYSKYERHYSDIQATIKTLINEVLATNQTLSDSEKVKVTVTKKGNGTAIASASATPTTSAVDTAQSYTVKLTYSNGRVTQIDIT